MIVETVLQKLFYSQDRTEPKRDPSNPLDEPYFKAIRGIHNQALTTWLTENGGERLLQDMEKLIIAKLTQLVVMDVKDVPDIIQMIRLREDIMKEAQFYDRIQSAFAEMEEKKKAFEEGQN